MESKRQLKFAKLIQKELAEIFQRDTKSLFGAAFITVTEVKVSPDFGLARTYLSFLLAENKREILEKVRENKSKIRNLLGSKIRKQARVIPDLEFYIDDTLDQAAKIEAIFNKLDIPKQGDTKGSEEAGS